MLISLTLLTTLLLAACSSSTPASSTGSEDSEGAESEESIFFTYKLQQAVENTITVSTDDTSSSTGRLDTKHTCEGLDTSLSLLWEGVPDDTVSLALILDDPTSDELQGLGLWTHWVLYSIPSNVTGLSEGEASVDVLGNGAQHGVNDYGNSHYNGPCPQPNIYFSESTDGRTDPVLAKERPYLFKLYAVDKDLELAPGLTRDALLEEIDGHIVAAGELSVPYKSRKKITRAGREVNQDIVR